MKFKNRIKIFFAIFTIAVGILMLNCFKAEAAMTKSCTYTVTNMSDNSSIEIRVYNDITRDWKKYTWNSESGTKSVYCGGSITVTYNSSSKSYTVTYNDVVIENYTPWIYCKAGTKTGYVATKFETTDGTATGNKNEVGIIVDNQDTPADAAGYISRYTGKGFMGVGATLEAQWTPISYTVKYDGNGATSGSTSSSSHAYDTAKALTTNGFARTGYRFAGWTTVRDGAVVYSNGQSVKNLTTTNGGTVQLYAKWTINTSTIYFHAGDSTVSSLSHTSLTGTIGSVTPMVQAYFKPGYHFSYTYNSVSGTYYVNPADWSFLNTDRHIYYYGAANTYYVDYYGNGATGGSTARTTHTYDRADNLRANGFTRTGYTFKGWSTVRDGAVVYSNMQSVVNLTTSNGGVVNLYAVWQDETAPTISISANPSTWTKDNVLITAAATDTGSGIKRIELYNGDNQLVSTSNTGTLTYTDTTAGVEKYRAVAIDNDNNSGEAATHDYIDRSIPDVRDFTINGEPVDLGNPNSDTLYHTIGWINEDVSVKLSSEDNASGMKSITMKDHYGNVIKTGVDTLAYTFTAEGSRCYTFVLTDNSDNTLFIYLTVKIDKTAPSIYDSNDELVEVAPDGAYLIEDGKINHRAYDQLSGIKTFKLYHEDHTEVVDTKYKYDETNHVIKFPSNETTELWWYLEAVDVAGNITSIKVSTPYNFNAYPRLDNCQEKTDKFLVDSDCKLYIDTVGYIDTIEIRFNSKIQAHALNEGYSLDYCIEDGNEIILQPAKETDSLCIDWHVPLGIGTVAEPDYLTVQIKIYRGGYSKTCYLKFNTISEEDYAKELARRIRRRIVNTTWDWTIRKKD